MRVNRQSAATWVVATAMLLVGISPAVAADTPVNATREAQRPAVASVEQSPTATIERLFHGLVNVAGQNVDIQQRYELLKPIIEATHDMPYIAELTIRRQWRDLAPEQRKDFVAAFERLSIMTYASRFGGLTKSMFEITGTHDARDGRAEVEATLTTPKGKLIPFQYLLHQVDGQWKIVNILADNVSDLALKRAEYREVLDKGSIRDLIARLDKQIQEAAKG